MKEDKIPFKRQDFVLVPWFSSRLDGIEVQLEHMYQTVTYCHCQIAFSILS